MYSIASSRRRRALKQAALPATQIRDLIAPTETVVYLDADIKTMTRLFSLHSVKYLYVIDASRCYRGTVALRDLSDKLINSPEESSFLKAADFMRIGVLDVLTPEMHLGDAVACFLRHRGERLPAVLSEMDPVLLGTVGKIAMLRTYFQLNDPR